MSANSPRLPASETPTAPVAEVDLAVTGMTCAACVARVEKKLNRLEGVQAVVNLATERAHVELFGELPDARLVETVEKAGYGAAVVRRVEAGKAVASGIDAREAEAEAGQSGAKRRADLRRRFLVALALSVPVVALSMVPAWEFPGWQWLAAVFATVVAFWCGWPFHRAAWRAARHGTTTMDTLVSLGVLASMGWSYWALGFGGAGRIGYTMAMSGAHSTRMAHLHVESAAMIVTFLLLGRIFEARSRHDAGDALRSLLELGATAARLVGEDGSERTVEAARLRAGDVFRVRPGEKIAADGVVVAGSSAVDASLLTGESAPVEVGPGSEVTGATLNTSGLLDIRATRVGEATTLAAMGRLLTEAQTGKAPIQRLADRVSAVFVPAVIAIATATFLVRAGLLGQPLETALTSAIAVLVVACPCALGLATPTALLVGSGRAAGQGILMKDAEVLEKARGIDTIVLDKTGTLTTGRMALVGIATPGTAAGAKKGDSDGRKAGAGLFARDRSEDLPSGIGFSPDRALGIAAGLEAGSEHPIGRSIVAAARERGGDCAPLAGVRDIRAHAGSGVSGTLPDGTRALAGTPAWLAGEGAAIDEALAAQAEHFAGDGSSVAMLAVSGPERGGGPEADGISTPEAPLRAVAVFAVRDELRPDAAAAVARLKELGVQPILVTGDNETTARAIAAQAGIDAVRAGVLPGGKVRAVEELRAGGRRVAMAGDGINDAPALAGADLSIAMGSGTDAAKAASDVTIVNSMLASIPRALEISARTLRVVKQNLGWAFGYNLVAIPLAVAGIVLPGMAAAAMASSSVVVVSNSLRLRTA